MPDRHHAAEWYQRVLGLEIVAEHRHWADDPRGPLMISSDAGSTKLALFQGDPQAGRPTAGFHRVAFSVSAIGFRAFVARLADLELTDHNHQPVTADSVVDHDQAFSIYFSDPSGHRLEVTTYEHEAVRAELAVIGEHAAQKR